MEDETRTLRQVQALCNILAGALGGADVCLRDTMRGGVVACSFRSVRQRCRDIDAEDRGAAGAGDTVISVIVNRRYELAAVCDDGAEVLAAWDLVRGAGHVLSHFLGRGDDGGGGTAGCPVTVGPGGGPRIESAEVDSILAEIERISGL